MKQLALESEDLDPLISVVIVYTLVTPVDNKEL